jgi:hypothetical protein
MESFGFPLLEVPTFAAGTASTASSCAAAAIRQKASGHFSLTMLIIDHRPCRITKTIGFTRENSLQKRLQSRRRACQPLPQSALIHQWCQSRPDHETRKPSPFLGAIERLFGEPVKPLLFLVVGKRKILWKIVQQTALAAVVAAVVTAAAAAPGGPVRAYGGGSGGTGS